MADPIVIGWVLPIGHTGPVGNMSFTNALGNSLTSLEAAILAADTGQVICNYRSVTKTATTYKFVLTETERNKFINLIPYNKTTARIRYTLRYVYNGTTYNVYADSSFSFNYEVAPILNPVAYDTFADTVALTGDDNIFIRGYSVVYANANPKFQYGALQQSQSIVCGSKKIGLSSAYIDNVQSGNITFSVTDTRGYTTTETITRQLIDYIKLSCSIKADLPTTSGTCKAKIQGAYFNGSFGAQSNTLALHYRIKEEGGEYGSWITVTPTISGNSYTADINVSGLNYQKHYTFQARAEDKLATVLSNEDTVRATPVFDWDKDDFKVNVPLILPHGGTQGIFSYNSNGDRVYVLQPSNDSNNLVLGYGNYANSLGDTNIYGNGINLTSKNGISLSSDNKLNLYGVGTGYLYTAGELEVKSTTKVSVVSGAYNTTIDGYKYGVNNVLWTGGLYMNASQSASLSQGVSAQPHGIVIVFSYYLNGAVDDSHFVSFFVPKNHVATYSGKGMVFTMRRHMVFAPCTKYLYITNTKITGHASNTESGTANEAANVMWQNNTFVMRRVIGV